ncbi:MAG: hypothetical protein AB1601_12065 [Planctomycetota bacterium]
MMRRSVLLVAVGLTLVPGCARQEAAIAAKPTVDELPRIPELEPKLPAVVVVEGWDHSSRARLVPAFESPPLTEEERRALGRDVPSFKFLPYADARPPVGSRVGWWVGGVETHAFGAGRPDTALNPATSVTGVAGWGGTLTEADPLAKGIAEVRPPREAVAELGPPSGLRVEGDTTDKRIAERQQRIER